jgi:hypothetical protein
MIVEVFEKKSCNNFHYKGTFDTKRYLLTRGMARVGKSFESKISKPTKLDCKQIFYCIVYHITLNSNCEAQRASKNLKKIVEDSWKSKIRHE